MESIISMQNKKPSIESGNIFIVTGGLGFIGSRLVKRLLKRGDKVYVIDNFSTGDIINLREHLKSSNLKIEMRNLNCDPIPEFNEKITGVFHLGMPSSSPMYRRDLSLIHSTYKNIVLALDYCRLHDCRLVYASTSSIYNGCSIPMKEDDLVKPMDFYSELRYYLERTSAVFHQMYGVNSVGLRLFSVYGENERPKQQYANMISQFIWGALKGESPVIYGDGEQTRDFIYVEDCVDAFVNAMDFANVKSDVINVGTGVSYSFNQIWEIIAKELSLDLKPKYVPNPIKNYVNDTLADIAKLKSLLKKTDFTDIESGIQKLIVHYSRDGYNGQ